MTATTPLCPECNHPVNKHDEFFCMVIECRCNNGKKAALALYERDVYKLLYEQSIELLSQKITIVEEDLD